jgi:2-C-methyl-D-erythritol 4-phosphate cytidylyltransferase
MPHSKPAQTLQRIPETAVVIASGGKGLRMGSVKNKNYLPLLGKPVLAHTLSVFEACPLVNTVTLVVPKNDIEFCKDEIVSVYGFKKIVNITAGGSERQDSVFNGINAATNNAKIRPGVIAVHDGARPLVSLKIIEDVIRSAAASGAAIAAVPVKDTVKEANNGFVSKTLARNTLWSVQTPQAFWTETLLEAYKKAHEDNFIGTDESSLAERLGVDVKIIEGSYENIKITTPVDMLFAEAVLKAR